MNAQAAEILKKTRARWTVDPVEPTVTTEGEPQQPPMTDAPSDDLGETTPADDDRLRASCNRAAQLESVPPSVETEPTDESEQHETGELDPADLEPEQFEGELDDVEPQRLTAPSDKAEPEEEQGANDETWAFGDPSPPDCLTLRRCQSAIRCLKEDREKLEPAVRRNIVEMALEQLFNDRDLPALPFGEIAQALYELAQDDYEQWVGRMFRRGLLLEVVSGPWPRRQVVNVVRLFRPQFVRELEIKTASEFALLDTALAALIEYSQLTIDIRVLQQGLQVRPDKKIAADSKVLGDAQKLLRTFGATILKLDCRPGRKRFDIREAGPALFEQMGKEAKDRAPSTSASIDFQVG